MVLETERCRIRNLQLKDLDALYAILSDPIVMREIEPPFDRTQTEDFIKMAGLIKSPLVYGLEWKQSNTLIGHVIYHPFNNQGYEIGWILHHNFWRMGVASEVTDALIRHAKENGITQLFLECSPQQTSTKHIASKFGFQQTESGSECCCYKLKIN